MITKFPLAQQKLEVLMRKKHFVSSASIFLLPTIKVFDRILLDSIQFLVEVVKPVACPLSHNPLYGLNHRGFYKVL